MKPIAAAIVTCFALFAVSMGATRFLLPTPSPDEELSAEETADGDSSFPDQDLAVEEGASELPVSFRPDAVTVEAVVQMSDSIREMEEELIKRQERVQKDEQRVALLFSDLETEHNELKSLGNSIDQKIQSLERMSEKLATDLNAMEVNNSKRNSVAQPQNDPQREALEAKATQIKGWFESMPPEQAADYLKEMANNGKLELAATVLQMQPDRQKSKILGSMQDPSLVEQLIDALTIKTK